MDSIINFIINCILSIIDLYLINFYILNYNYRTDENKKYLRFNICNFICFIILVFLNIFSPNYIICIFTKIIVILLQLFSKNLFFLNNLKIIFYYIILETIIHLLCHFIFSWIFDTIIISSYPKFVLSYILLVLLIEKYIIYTLFARDLAIQTQNILKEKEYIYKRISVDEKERKMRHDVRNNLDIVYGYLRDKKYEKAENLVKELLGVVEERDALIHTGNVSIDSVIDDKLSLAKEKNIIYEENTKNMYYGDIEINELALLIGLALDNAIEACEKVEENRYIYFEARNKKDYLVIHITNSIIPHTKPRFYKTSKLVDKMNHGFGVEEIKDIVKRYDGDIQYDTKEDRVILRIILKTKKD